MKQPLKIAAYAGIISLIVSLYMFLEGAFFESGTTAANVSSEITVTLMILSSLVIYFGYLFLAKKYNAKLLKVMTIIGIVLTIFVFVMFILGTVFSGMGMAQADEHMDLPDIPTASSGDMLDYGDLSSLGLNEGEMSEIVYAYIIIFFIIFSIIFGAYFVLFGFGVLKLKKDIKYAKHTGITYIVAGFSAIIIIGYFILLLAQIFEIMMFFSASEKLEKGKRKTSSKSQKRKRR